jgi:hypothetical protein
MMSTARTMTVLEIATTVVLQVSASVPSGWTRHDWTYLFVPDAAPSESAPPVPDGVDGWPLVLMVTDAVLETDTGPGLTDTDALWKPDGRSSETEAENWPPELVDAEDIEAEAEEAELAEEEIADELDIDDEREVVVEVEDEMVAAELGEGLGGVDMGVLLDCGGGAGAAEEGAGAGCAVVGCGAPGIAFRL